MWRIMRGLLITLWGDVTSRSMPELQFAKMAAWKVARLNPVSAPSSVYSRMRNVVPQRPVPVTTTFPIAFT